MTDLVDATTGELLGQVTIPAINADLVRLSNALDRNSDELRRLIAEKQHVDLAYKLHYHATVVTSAARSADQRKAEAEMACAQVPSDETGAESLAEAAARLDMQLRAEREAGHNIRAQMSGLQTVASNLRAEINGLGWRP